MLTAASPAYMPLEALASTGNVPGGVLTGGVLAIVTDPLCPGVRVNDVAEKVVGHPEGSPDPRLKVLEGHPAESLLVTIRLALALFPGVVLGLRGDALTIGLARTQGVAP